MHIALVGTRGIPANYGGFETFAEQLSIRLVARGHRVTVYGRSHYVPGGLGEHQGVRLVVLPTVRHKYLDTVVHTAVSVGHALFGRYDVVLVCNAANALFCAVPRLVGSRVVLNVDGLERQRKKWNALGRAWDLMSERLATLLPSAIVTDARVIERYYDERYHARTSYIPYGADLPSPAGTATLQRLGLAAGEYVLYVSRLEPENNALAVVEGFQKSKLNKKLAVVGDAPYAREYIARLKDAAGPRVVFTGGVYGDGYRELQSHAFVYVHATEVGGTHPALVEAMGFGNCVLVNDVPENREVGGEAALYFRAAAPESLAALLDQVAADDTLRTTLASRARERARSAFSWDMVTDRYEALFRQMLGEETHA